MTALHGTLLGSTLLLASVTGLAAQDSLATPGWDVTVGAVGLLTPAYPGSDHYRVLPLPMSQVTLDNRVFLGPSTSGLGLALGAYAIRGRTVDVVTELGLQDERPASRADALAGMRDRDVVVSAGGSILLHEGPIQVVFGVARGLNDGAGILGTSRITVSRSLGRLQSSVSAGATYADARQMRREFGVTGIEAGRRQALIEAGDDRLGPGDGVEYQPDGGLRHLGVSLSLMYPLSAQWSLLGFAGVDRLSKELDASPVVRRREQYSTGIGLGYRLP
jgi:outer membrane scaffolding protein for murein synthesis (MipA/OmpV family)